MEISKLKEYILENDCIENILEELGCHSISHKDGYYTAANPDGDNKHAICVYENQSITTVDYTRQISEKQSADIINLVQFFIGEPFFGAIKWICEKIGIDYYFKENIYIPESLKITKFISEMDSNSCSEEDEAIRMIPEKILSYYNHLANEMFIVDGIDEQTQKEFEIGYDPETNRITIPIRDEIGNLVGVKGRFFGCDNDEMKYYYLEPCPRFKILYGLYKTYDHIVSNKIVYVFESEKAVMQCWSNGIKNTVATGGKKVSKNQIEMLTRLCVPICFCFDKDVERDELDELAKRFIPDVAIYILEDKDNVLKEKQSPSDNISAFKHLIKNQIRIK